MQVDFINLQQFYTSDSSECTCSDLI